MIENKDLVIKVNDNGTLSMKNAKTVNIYYDLQYKQQFKGEIPSAEFFRWCEEKNKQIREKCVPQEVYCMEYNNHECMYDWDGDWTVIDLMKGIFGKDIVEKIKRF